MAVVEVPADVLQSAALSTEALSRAVAEDYLFKSRHGQTKRLTPNEGQANNYDKTPPVPNIISPDLLTSDDRNITPSSSMLPFVESIIVCGRISTPSSVGR